MKKILLTIAAIALFAVPANAQMYSVWTDAGFTDCDYTGPNYMPFPVYFVLEPGPTGAFAAEYKFNVPSNLLTQETHPSPVISVAEGTATNGYGISVGFLTCQSEAFVIYDFLFVPLGDTPGYLTVTNHDNTGKLIIAECPGDRAEIPATVYNNFGFNTSCVVGTEESSWGAIKSMMD